MDRPPTRDGVASKKPSPTRGKRKASQEAARPPVSHDDGPSPQGSRTAGTNVASHSPGTYCHPLARNGAQYSVPVSHAAALPAVPFGSGSSSGPPFSIPMRASLPAAATSAESFERTMIHNATSSAAAQDAIVRIRLRQELNRLEQEQSILSLINWGNRNSSSSSSSSRSSFDVRGGYPWSANTPSDTGAALLPPAWGQLPPAEYYYRSGASAAVRGPGPVTSALLASEMNLLREMDALLWRRQVYAAAAATTAAATTAMAPQHSLTGLRAPVPSQQDPTAAQRGAAPPVSGPRDGGAAAALSVSAASPDVGPDAATSLACPLPIPSSSSNATSYDAAAGTGHCGSSSSSSSSPPRPVPVPPVVVDSKGKRRRFRTAAEADAENAPGPTSTSGRVIPMARDADAVHSSRYQCLLREQIEYFEADDDALHAKAQGRNMPIQLRQVGIRCVHCARRPATTGRKGAVHDGEVVAARMVRGAVYYPTKLDNLYQAVQNMANNHFVNRTCPSAPSSLLDEIVEAKRLRPKRSGGRGRRYFGQSAERAGIIDAPDGSGLFFAAAVGSMAATGGATTSSAARPS
jgi:hypothetical protein